MHAKARAKPPAMRRLDRCCRKLVSLRLIILGYDYKLSEFQENARARVVACPKLKTWCSAATALCEGGLTVENMLSQTHCTDHADPDVLLRMVTGHLCMIGKSG